MCGLRHGVLVLTMLGVGVFKSFVSESVCLWPNRASGENAKPEDSGGDTDAALSWNWKGFGRGRIR